MQFTEDEANEVKKWVVRKLEDISDADSDVLADYVLALIRSDAPNDEIRKASVENLEDFLREHTASFVDELFATFGPKPQQQQQQQQNETPAAMPASQQETPVNAPSGPSRGSYGYPQGQGPQDGGNFSRKRSYNDSEQDGSEEQPSYNRAYKTPRRGRGGGRGDWMGRDGRPTPGGPGAAAGFPQPGPGGFPVMPPGFPGFDQNDPMAAMMAMQGMGFPQMPGMPPMPMPPAVPGQQPQPDQMGKSSERCPFYETQGICYLGATCPYQHDAASKKEDEYDPKASGIMSDMPPRRGGGDRGRGRGRGRGGGDHGGFGGRGRRSEFSAAGPNEDTSITTIVVEQIPEEKLNEESVREFFSQYGEIVDLSLQPHRKLALVTYDSHNSAKQAWSSPKVIFDNRFVKVYWHKPKTDGRGEGGNGAPEAPAFNQEEFERQQEEAQRAYEEKMQRRKETEEAKQALEQQRDDLLRKQQEERERLLQRIQEKGGSLNGIGGDAMATDDGSGTSTTAGAAGADDENVSDQTKQLRAQLAFLEAEAKSLGLDPSKSEAGASGFGARGRGRGGFPGYRGRGGFYAPRGRGYDPSYRGRGRGGAFRGGGRGGVMRLDNRPRRIAVSGVDNPNKDEGLRQYLIGLGEYESIEPNTDQPDTLTVVFKERYQAEKFMFGPWNIPSVGEVQLTWLPNPPLPTTGSGTSTPSGAADGNKAGAGGVDDDMMGMDHENENEESRKEPPAGAHDVDYDVAEMDDNWGG